MGKGIYYIFSTLVSIIVLIMLMRFFGVTWADVDYFITNGISGACRVFGMLRDSIISAR